MKNRVVAWWSGGLSSALAAKWAVDMFRNVEVVFLDTRNEDDDTYRFFKDCEKWYGVKIQVLTNSKYASIEDVWMEYLSLNTANGAICSTELKRAMREKYQNLATDYAQIFGFDANERERHNNMRRNYPEINVISPLIDSGTTKAGVVRIFLKAGIEIPRAYKLGYRNNNCLKTGCVRGGIGYWKKIEVDDPEKFDRMAVREHTITDLKGEPVTILKDRTGGKVARLFLKPHPAYPEIKDLSTATGREVEALVECTGFCGTTEPETE